MSEIAGVHRFRRLARCSRAFAMVATAVLCATALTAQGTRRGLEPRPSSGASSNGFGTYHAIIFAVGDQQPSSGLPSLKFPLKEADSLRAVITREYTFEPKNVQVVRNPTREAILDSLESVARRLGPDDNLLVVYSGHGGFDEAGREGYWLAADAANSRKSTWIPNESIRTWLRTLKARSVLLITDACFSGSLNRSNDDRVTLSADRRMAVEGALRYARRTSRQAMTAGTAKETVPQVSIFSMEIIAALKRHIAPVFMAQQLAGEINPRVAAVAHTTPTFSAVPGIESDQGDFVFVRRETSADVVAVDTRPAPTPTPERVSGVQRGGAGQTDASRTSIPPGGEGSLLPTRVTPATTTRPTPNTGASNAAGSNGGAKLGNIGSTTTAAPASTSAAPSVARPAASRAAQGCIGGVSSGCVTQGLNLENGRNGTTRNIPRALELYRLACDAQDPEGCMHVGRMYDTRRDGISMDRGKARQLFAQACDGGSGAACTFLGLAAAKGEGGPQDDSKAAQLYTKGCDLGHNQGCGLLGVATANGKGVPQSDSRAAALLQRSCGGGDVGACNTLGLFAANGRGGMARDSTKSIGYWRQACTGATGLAESCAYLGLGYLRGAGVMRDDVRAGQYLSQGCEGGVAIGCTALASMYETGTSVTAVSITRAAEFYTRGCTGGDPKACAWTAAHPQPAKK